jgi:crotonobetainyl-CoA:carnitine CoA-transferase CaiB-like acyl-CoA transferase
MVLPSDDHVVLRQWLATRGVEASELAGILVTGDLDPLLAVSGSHRRLAAVDRQEVAEARAIARDNPEWPELNDLGAAACELRVSAVLEEVCEALGRAGVPATPYQGLGVSWGHELLEAKVMVRDVRTLYERMAQAAPGEPA